MSWNNRIFRKTKRNPIKGGKPRTLHFYDVHEVYYDRKGRAMNWTTDPMIGGYESIQDLRLSLAQMLIDCLRAPVIEIKKVNGKEVLRHRANG